MTKLHKLIRISHDGTTFFIRPATVRSTVRFLTARLRSQSGGSAGQDRNDRIGASPRTVRTVEPVPPPLEGREKRHAAPDTKGAKHPNRQRPYPSLLQTPPGRSGPAGRRLQERRVWSLPVRVFRAFRVRCGVPFFASFERGRNRFHRSDSARRGSDPVVSVLAGGASALRPEPRCQKADRAPYGCRPDKKSRPVVGNPD